MFSPSSYYQRRDRIAGLSRLAKCISQPTVAIVLFVLLAILAALEDRNSKVLRSDYSRTSSSGSALGYAFSKCVASVRPFLGAIKEQFDAPALVEYAKKQGADIDDLSSLSQLGGSTGQGACSSRSQKSKSH
jgi:hypothetical protein